MGEQTVVSAAHCFDLVSGLAAPDTVRLGETDLNLVGEGGGHLDLPILRWGVLVVVVVVVVASALVVVVTEVAVVAVV